MMVPELRHAMRRLAASPTFTLAAILTLALAIGANVAIFAVVYRVVLNPLPYGDSSRLLAIDYGWPSRNIASGVSTITSRMYFQYVDRATTLDGTALYETLDVTMTGQGDPERIQTIGATPSLSAVLRVPPVVGRWFTDEEGVPGAGAVAVLSHGF